MILFLIHLKSSFLSLINPESQVMILFLSVWLGGSFWGYSFTIWLVCVGSCVTDISGDDLMKKVAKKQTKNKQTNK